ncbi:MAG: hypothetical protein COT14_02685 [Candidatus Diapherotrites archaeon CG08_land_8_20_14_0_20_30_16]|nr:MAG: hypothetical protein COT14_02685 [Candidatus Diapherotrites archaeon CG08_land_8_20_14_0_20_30_16]
MDLFTFAISLLVMLIAMQYGYFWIVVVIGAILIFMGKSKHIFIIVIALIILLFLIRGTPYEGYNVYCVALGIGAFLLMNKEEAADTYNPEDQYGDLLKGLGGGSGGI